MQLNVAAAGLCQRKETFYHFLKLFCSAADNVHIILTHRAQFLFLQQLYVAHHGCEGCLQVMRYIGNKIHLKLFTLSSLFHTLPFHFHRLSQLLSIDFCSQRNKLTEFFFKISNYRYFSSSPLNSHRYD